MDPRTPKPLEAAGNGEEVLFHKEQQLEEAHREAQAQGLRYQELFDFSPDGIVETDTRGVILQANYAAADLLRARKHFVAGKPLAFFVAPECRSDFYRRLCRVSPIGPAEQWETRLQSSGMDSLEILLSVTALLSEDGQPAGFHWLLRDITSRRRAEFSLRAEKDLTDSLLNTAEAVVLVVDNQNCIVRANPYLYTAAGHEADDVRGLDWCDLLLAVDDRSQGQDMVRRAREYGSSKSGVLGLLTRDGHERAVAWSAKSLGQGFREGEVLLLGQDVTELQEAQKQALQAERLAAIGQMVAGLAHESRNALQRMQSCLTLLGFRLKEQPEALDLLHRTEKAKDDLHQLFEEVREYAAPVQLEPRSRDLAPIWREAWTDLTQLRPNKAAELREEINGIDRRCRVSAFHLRQVFRNLLENALTAGGKAPWVRICCTAGAIEGREAVQVAVCDNGPGFKAEDREKVFKPFFTTKTRGTGLGLAICKRVVEAHGGRIAVGEGPGGVILITLPREPL